MRGRSRALPREADAPSFRDPGKLSDEDEDEEDEEADAGAAQNEVVPCFELAGLGVGGCDYLLEPNSPQEG